MNDNKVSALYLSFSQSTVNDLEAALLTASSREEKAFYRALINLKLQLDQEKVVGEKLV